MRLGEIRDRLKAAAAGELAEFDDPHYFEPVRSEPSLWEHKWSFESESDGPDLYRLYHAEPASPRALVALCFHQKVIGGSQDEIDARQQERMQEAARRFEHGRPFGWVRSQPTQS